MKRKIMWSLIGSMIVASLVLVSCAGGGGGGGNGGGGGGGGGEGEQPKYGGTITYGVLRYEIGLTPLELSRDSSGILHTIFDMYYTIPWEKGPEGTKELMLNSSWYPRSTYRGEMLESWEVIDLYTVRYKLRQGIHYWDKEPVNGRELTVDDIMWNWLYLTFHPKIGAYGMYPTASDPGPALNFWTDYLTEIKSGKFTDERLIAHLAECKQYTPEWESYYPGLKALVTSKYADSYAFIKSKGYDVANLTLLNPFLHKIDKYNFEVKSARCNRELWSYINFIWPTPREVTEVDEFNDPETVVGTGPWILERFEPGTGASFIRNPEYWQYDPLHPENQLPYADELHILAIWDEAAYYAALETAQIDMGSVEWYKVQYFKDNYPDMENIQEINNLSHLIFLRNDIPPFNDIRVRKACMLGIDHQAMINDHYRGMAQLLTWPEQPWLSDVYIPLEELPAEIQELFTYNPTKAKQLLADAGYPDGFQTKLYTYPSREDIESCMIVQGYLKDIGIDVILYNTEYNPGGLWWGTWIWYKTYDHMISCWWGNNFPGDAMNWAEGGVLTSPWNFGRVDDPISYETSQAISCMADDDDYYAMIKADNVRRLMMMYQIILPTPVGNIFWWPWLKNYHGETTLGWPDVYGYGGTPKYLWIDQALKASMTG